MSKTNIRMSQPTYIVKKDDGVIICKITTNGNTESFKIIWESNYLQDKFQKKLPIEWIGEERTFKAVARYHKSDVWNEVTGKRIAESKCKKKIYNFYKRLYKIILKEIIEADVRDLIRYVDNLTLCEDREEKYIKELTMKISIDEDVVAKCKTSDNKTLNIGETLVCMLIKMGYNINDIIDDLIFKGVLIRDNTIPDKLLIFMKYSKLVETILLKSDKSIPKEEELLSLVEKLQALFPSGRKCDDSGIPKWSWRGNKTDVVKKLQKFFKLYGNYKQEDIIQATTNYVNRYKYDNKAMRILPYFIYKEIDGGISDLATELESLDNNNGSELIRQYNYDSSEVVV